MKELSSYLFSHYSTVILFLHVLSAIIWIGGMIAIRFAVHYSVQQIEEPSIKLRTTLQNLRFFFKWVIPSIIMLILTALIMMLAIDFKAIGMNGFVHIKEAVWTVMTLLFILIYTKHYKALIAYEKSDFSSVKQQLKPIASYLIPINIVLGLIALLLGIILRGM